MSSLTFIEFVVVRHGETDSNKEGTVQGQVDSELNKLGLRQAAAAAEYLHGVHFDGCVSSDLRRAVDTARIILAAGHEGVSIRQTPLLREWDLGDLENQPIAELYQNHPAMMRPFRYASSETIHVPGGESSAEFLGRVRSAMQRLTETYQAEQRVLVVTHGAVISRILQVATGLLSQGNRIPLVANASVSIVWYFPAENAWELTAWNLTDHLKGLPVHDTLKF